MKVFKTDYCLSNYAQYKAPELVQEWNPWQRTTVVLIVYSFLNDLGYDFSTSKLDGKRNDERILVFYSNNSNNHTALAKCYRDSLNNQSFHVRNFIVS